MEKQQTPIGKPLKTKHKKTIANNWKTLENHLQTMAKTLKQHWNHCQKNMGQTLDNNWIPPTPPHTPQKKKKKIKPGNTMGKPLENQGNKT